MTITDYKLKDFLKCDLDTQLEYTKLLMMCKPSETNLNLIDLKLKHVDSLKISELHSMDVIVKVLSKMCKCSKKDIYDMRVSKFFPLVVNIKEQLKKIFIAESKLVLSESNVKWDIVGGSKRVSKLGIYNTLIPLSQQLSMTLDEVYNMPYSDVYAVLMYNKTHTEISKDMNEIKTNI